MTSARNMLSDQAKRVNAEPYLNVISRTTADNGNVNIRQIGEPFDSATLADLCKFPGEN